MRNRISIVVVMFLLGFGITAYAGIADTPWPMYMHDVRHTGQSEYKGSEYPVLQWDFYVEGEDFSPLVVGSDGTFYFISQDWSVMKGGLYSVSPDGSLSWKMPVGSLYNGRLSPAVGADGTVYFSAGGDEICAVSPEGKELWRSKLDGVCVSSPILADDGTIYIASHEGYLYALNPEGSERWKVSTEGLVKDCPAISQDGTLILSIFYEESIKNALVLALNPDGSEKWKFTMDQPYISAPSVGDDGTVYVGAHEGYYFQGTSYLYALNPDGTLAWRADACDYVIYAPAIGKDGTIYISQGYSGDAMPAFHGYISAYDPDGDLLWDFDAQGEISSHPLIDADGTLYFASMNRKLTNEGYIYAVNPDGIENWRLFTGYVATSLCVGPNGTIYAGGGSLSAYGNHEKIQVKLYAAPARSCYDEGDKIKLLLDFATLTGPFYADIYLLLLNHTADTFSFAFDWGSSPVPIISNLYLPEGVDFDGIPLFEVILPSLKVPLSDSGEYTFLFVTTKAGTDEFTSNVGTATVTLDFPCRP